MECFEHISNSQLAMLACSLNKVYSAFRGLSLTIRKETGCCGELIRGKRYVWRRWNVRFHLPAAVVSTESSLQNTFQVASTVASPALATSYSNKTVPKHKYFPREAILLGALHDTFTRRHCAIKMHSIFPIHGNVRQKQFLVLKEVTDGWPQSPTEQRCYISPLPRSLFLCQQPQPVQIQLWLLSGGLCTPPACLQLKMIAR